MTTQYVTECAASTTAYLATVRRWQDVPRRRPTYAERRATIEHRTGSGTERYAIAHEPMDHAARGANP